MVEILEDNIYPIKLRKNGDSYYLLFSTEILGYLGIKNPEDEVLILKTENHKKYGHYIAIGKDKR